MTAEDANIGRLVSARYRLDKLLGRGGFGSVYRGWDTQIGRDVAVKLLDVRDGARSTQQTVELCERFRREAMAAGRISHRGIVTIFDFGIPDDGDDAFLVMELLEGHDLAAELASTGPMTPARAQRLFVPMLEGLGRGHEMGIVHKDIKPQNVFLRHPGTNSEALCLVDFGIARIMHEDKLTLTGLIVGTPQYMAPEYITDTTVTPALDVYQMGLILVEVITGMPAVPGGESFVKSCNRHFTGELAIPEQLKQGEFGKMLEEALRPNPAKRLPNAARLAEMFAAIDPSTVVIDSSKTMVFSRPPTLEADRSSLYPPMNPEQVSAELERLEKASDVSSSEPDTAVSAPPTETIDREVATTEPPADPVPSPAPPAPTAPEHAPQSIKGFVVAIVVLLAVAVTSVVVGLSVDDPAPEVGTSVEVAVPTNGAPQPTKLTIEPVLVVEPEVEPPGETIAVDSAPPVVDTDPVPTKRQPAVDRKPFAGRVFDPDDTGTDSAPTTTADEPKKFVSPPKDEKPKWVKPPEPLGIAQ